MIVLTTVKSTRYPECSFQTERPLCSVCYSRLKSPGQKSGISRFPAQPKSEAMLAKEGETATAFPLQNFVHFVYN